MKKIIAALACSLSAAAFAGNAITIVSNTPLSVTEAPSNATYTPQSGNIAASFSVGTRQAHVRARFTVNASLSYDVQLASVATAQGDLVVGLWDVYRNGVLVCNGCVGRMWGLVPNTLTPLTISIGDAYSASEKWRFSGTVNYRNEF